MRAIALIAVAAVVASCGGGGGTSAIETIDPVGAQQFTSPAPHTAAYRAPIRSGTSVTQGPFNDRVRILNLHLKSGRRPHLTGRLRGTVDVSDLLLLEVRADFFDRSGVHLGSRRLLVREGDPGSTLGGDVRFDLTPTARLARTADRAALSIPQLVNE